METVVECFSCQTSTSVENVLVVVDNENRRYLVCDNCDPSDLKFEYDEEYNPES